MRALRILLVEPAASPQLAPVLARGGHEILSVDDHERPTRLLGVFDPEVIVVAAPDGTTICRALRQAAPDHGILMIAGSAGPAQRVAGLQAGADDCLPTPFDAVELLVRVDAIWRRTRPTQRQARGRAAIEPRDHSQHVNTTGTEGHKDGHAKPHHNPNMQPNPTDEKVRGEMNAQLEADVRAALYDKAESVPDGAIERLRRIDYNPATTDTRDPVRRAIRRLIHVVGPRRSSDSPADEDRS